MTMLESIKLKKFSNDQLDFDSLRLLRGGAIDQTATGAGMEPTGNTKTIQISDGRGGYFNYTSHEYKTWGSDCCDSISKCEYYGVGTTWF